MNEACPKNNNPKFHKAVIPTRIQENDARITHRNSDAVMIAQRKKREDNTSVFNIKPTPVASLESGEHQLRSTKFPRLASSMVAQKIASLGTVDMAEGDPNDETFVDASPFEQLLSAIHEPSITVPSKGFIDVNDNRILKLMRAFLKVIAPLLDTDELLDALVYRNIPPLPDIALKVATLALRGTKRVASIAESILCNSLESRKLVLQTINRTREIIAHEE